MSVNFKGNEKHYYFSFINKSIKIAHETKIKTVFLSFPKVTEKMRMKN